MPFSEESKLILDGQWGFSLDPDRNQMWNEDYSSLPDDTIQVPGSIEEQGFGEPSLHFPIGAWKKDREYEGVAWYVKEIEIPPHFFERDLYLILKGVRWFTELWIDGEPVGKEDSLSSPQSFDITSFVKAGKKHRFVIRLDNQMHMPLQESHIHSYHTSTYWGGITGGAEILSSLQHTIDNVTIDCDIEREMIDLKVQVCRKACKIRDNWELLAKIYDESGELVNATSKNIIDNKRMSDLEEKISISLGENTRVWSPEDPHLYKVELSLIHEGSEYDIKTTTFGFRTITTSSNQILLNGRPIFLTGYVDCCIFPNTGYPVWDVEHYKEQFRIVKTYGFNHVRLHGWTPPEPFWQAADEAGMLVQTELPHWSRQYTDSMKASPENVHAFLKRELESIIHTIHKHPSFVMLSMGNELIGDDGHPQLNEFVQYARELDPSRIYTDNTGHGMLPSKSREGDFFVPTLNWHPPYNIDHAATADTTTDYGEVTRLENKPLIAHEHGQFTMYVRPEEENKYRGVLKPHWLETINSTLKSKGLDGRVNEFVKATGVHLIRALKENLEKARRTPGLSGIQLLDIRDFPGQGHATVGILDVFWDSKNVIDPEEFRQFNDQTVLLMRSKKRTFFNDEQLVVNLELSHFGIAIESALLNWSLSVDKQVWKSGSKKITHIPGSGLSDLIKIQEDLQGQKAKKITLHVSITIQGRVISNEWSFWLFPRQSLPKDCDRIWTNIADLRSTIYGLRVEETLGINEHSFKPEKNIDLAITDEIRRDVLQYLVDGGNVWLMAKENNQYDEVITRYLPTFWNYLWFPEQVGTTMGMRIHPHPVTDPFPNDGYSDWNWYHLVDRTIALNLESIPNVKPIVEVVDNFNRAKKLAYAFEVKVGNGNLFVSTFHLTDRKIMKSPESQFLFFQIIRYLKSDAFQPHTSVTIGDILGIFKVKSLFKLRY